MTRRKQAGFSLLETLVSLVVLMAVGGIVMTGMGQMMTTQGTIANRTNMHTSVRSATELLQQEIGQAGKISLSDSAANVTLNAAVAAGANVPFTLQSSTSTPPSVYVGEFLTFDVGSNQEAVQVGGSSTSPTGTFLIGHAKNAPVFALGAFATGIVPPTSAPANYPTGSSDTVLKLYGDINGDGNMMYVEYTCTQGTVTNPGFLYRNQMSIGAGAKPANAPKMILLNNVLANPKDPAGNVVPCFAYQVQPISGGYCVTNVAVTLTVQTQNVDTKTRVFQTETKALLNVAPRNVVEVYATANLVDPLRAQPIPATVTGLLGP
jgi:type II secretory pathway pseudopilin PulG